MVAKIAKAGMRIRISFADRRRGISASKQTKPIDPGQVTFARERGAAKCRDAPTLP
jgi:hypothetical protein